SERDRVAGAGGGGAGGVRAGAGGAGCLGSLISARGEASAGARGTGSSLRARGGLRGGWGGWRGGFAGARLGLGRRPAHPPRQHPIDRQPVFLRPHLAVPSRAVRVRVARHELERALGCDALAHALGAIFDVALDEELAGGTQEAREVIEEALVDDPALGVAL